MKTETDRKREFLRWLDEQREGRGWSKRQLALHMDVDPSAVQRWYTTDRMPDYRSAVELASLFMVPTSVVLDMVGFGQEQSSPESAQTQHLIGLVRLIDWRLHEQAYRMVRGMLLPLAEAEKRRRGEVGTDGSGDGLDPGGQ